MELKHQDQSELDLQSFDLGEAGGGIQMIIADKAINENEHYVFTLGDGPKAEQNAAAAKEPTKTDSSIKGLLNNFRNQFGAHKAANPNPAAAETDNPDNLKLRCFKLTRVEGLKDNQFRVQEYVTPKGVADVARLFGAGNNEPEIVR